MAESEEQVKGSRLVDERIEDMSRRLEKIETHFKTGLAVISLLGIGGVVGFNMIASASSLISGLDTELAKVESNLEDVNSRAEQLESTYREIRDEVIPPLRETLTQLRVDTVVANKDVELALVRIEAAKSDSVNTLNEGTRDARDRVNASSQSTIAEIDSEQRKALEMVRGEMDTALATVQEEKDSAIKDLDQEISRRLAEMTKSVIWEDCIWHEIGHDESHHPERSSDWCPSGRFITQLDLNRRKGLEVYVHRARCCAPGYES